MRNDRVLIPVLHVAHDANCFGFFCLVYTRIFIDSYRTSLFYHKNSMIRKYHNHKPQTTPWHHEEDSLNHHETPGGQIKQSNQLSLPHQDDCNTRMDTK